MQGPAGETLQPEDQCGGNRAERTGGKCRVPGRAESHDHHYQERPGGRRLLLYPVRLYLLTRIAGGNEQGGR